MKTYKIYRTLTNFAYAEVEAKDDKEIMELKGEGVVDEHMIETHLDEEYKIIDENGRVVHHENCG